MSNKRITHRFWLKIRSHSTEILITLVVIAPMSLLFFVKNPDDQKQFQKRLEVLRSIAVQTPLYPGFRQVDSTDIVKREGAVLTFFYQSSASYGDVKNFYTKELGAKGWGSPEEGIAGSNTRLLTFHIGEYSIVVNWDSDGDEGWDYALDYVWK